LKTASGYPVNRGFLQEGIVNTTPTATQTPSRQRITLRLVGVAGIVTLGLLPATIRGASADEANVAKEEAQFVTLINEVRASVGAQPLSVNVELERVARGWTKKMKAAGDISHNPDLAKEVTADWRKLGENVGVGPTVELLHAAFIKSPAHYKNLVDPAFDSVGITIEYSGDSFYITEQFMDVSDRATPAPGAAPSAQAATPGASVPPNQLALKPKVRKPKKKAPVKAPASIVKSFVLR
jgi:uncharacterized protein YkwD